MADSRLDKWVAPDDAKRPRSLADPNEWLPPEYRPMMRAQPEGADDWFVQAPPAVAPERSSEWDAASNGAEPAVGDRADLNLIGFEGLRAIGLSATQTARVLARREQLGVYSSTDQLDDLIGFPAHTLETLKSQVQVLGGEGL